MTDGCRRSSICTACDVRRMDPVADDLETDDEDW